jgi:hypothetical protein
VEGSKSKMCRLRGGAEVGHSIDTVDDCTTDVLTSGLLLSLNKSDPANCPLADPLMSARFEKFPNGGAARKLLED